VGVGRFLGGVTRLLLTGSGVGAGSTALSFEPFADPLRSGTGLASAVGRPPLAGLPLVRLFAERTAGEPAELFAVTASRRA
jgi:hypothetical protein